MLTKAVNNLPTKKATKKLVYLTTQDIEESSDSLILAMWIKYRHGQFLKAPRKALLARVDQILARVPIKLNKALQSDEEAIKECWGRLMHGASVCTCGNHRGGY